MLRANIYTIEPLSPEIQDSVEDGVRMVVTYIGHIAVTRSVEVRLPLSQEGKVDPGRVGLSNLDGMVELHVMAVPLDRSKYGRFTSGMSAFGVGVGFVDTSVDKVNSIRLTTAHEVGHSLGFVSNHSGHEDPNSANHCSDKSCVMHQAGLQPEIDALNPPEGSREARLLKQFDFCLDCKVDMRSKGEENLQRLRHSRVVENGVIKGLAGLRVNG